MASDPAPDELSAAQLRAILQQFLAGQPLYQRQQLQLQQSLSSLWPALPSSSSSGSSLVDRLQQLQELYPLLNAFCQDRLGWPCPLDLLWRLWLPLAQQILDWRQVQQSFMLEPLMLGIVGLQGTGKTTLTLILAEILRSWGWRVAQLSIDDLYKTYAERQQLQQLDPRFCWRGPPGTHDLELGLSVLQNLRQLQPTALPRFDKSAQQGAGDRGQPEWVGELDLLLFEGWFVGLRPIDPACFETAPPPIQTTADRDFAREVNRRLANYLPLWAQLDRLVLIYPTDCQPDRQLDYRLSQRWRRQAEQQRIATGQPGMPAAEVDAFVKYFWRALHPALFLPPLLASDRLDLAIQVSPDRVPIQISYPASNPD